MDVSAPLNVPVYTVHVMSRYTLGFDSECGVELSPCILYIQTFQVAGVSLSLKKSRLHLVGLTSQHLCSLLFV